MCGTGFLGDEAPIGFGWPRTESFGDIVDDFGHVLPEELDNERRYPEVLGVKDGANPLLAHEAVVVAGVEAAQDLRRM
ncbi:hypothetical protein ABFW00_20890 [Mycobacteroides abscessus]|uniref:hypothetical protein n=1 Tax=Mycobacteroides abscessus TaxID=36809 RepID=UPI0019D2F319|nr:hypothetical protein [Mycobacteroides abscessus]MBN7558010.1 hypothetical protein [Mycobacteroides abscessus subsp. abscessus]